MRRILSEPLKRVTDCTTPSEVSTSRRGGGPRPCSCRPVPNTRDSWLNPLLRCGQPAVPARLLLGGIHRGRGNLWEPGATTCPRFDTPLPSAMHKFPASLKPEVEKWLENYLAEASTRRESPSEREVRRRVRMELDFEPRSANSATGTRFPCYSLTNLMLPLQG